MQAYGLLTGEEVDLFLDQDRLAWGDDWEAKIDSNLADVAFFIPVITPRFFASAQCRRELSFFARRAERLGVAELVMPILYSDVRALHETGMDDEAIALVRRFQWEDWTTLRFEERASALYRKAVAAMASQIAKANEDADNTASLRAIPESNDEQEAEEGPGLLDTLAEMEEALPRWNDAVGEVREAVERIGLIATSASTSIEKANHAPKPMAARMLVLKKAASQFQIEAEQLKRVSAGFTTDLNEIDAGMRATVALVRLQSDPDEIRAACEFFGVVRALADSSEEGLVLWK